MKHFKLIGGLFLLAALNAAVFGLFSSEAEAAVPKLINFQGILKDGSGNPVANGSYSVTFTIYDAPTGGNNLWTETQSVSTTSGLFAVLLGFTNPIPDSAFNSPNRWLAIKVGADPEMTPRQQLVSLGYAYRVGTLDGASGGTITSKVSIGPGHTNTGAHAFVAGANNAASGDSSAVGGGGGNVASNKYATISGGRSDSASGLGSVVGGGSFNVASGEHGTVGGGYTNRASGPFDATVAGGSFNTASGDRSTIGGGVANAASGNRATVGGGNGNVASNTYATVGGGSGNIASGLNATVGGGYFCIANNEGSTVGGGSSNTAQGKWATVPGGLSNTAAGNYSFAAGRRAKAFHLGSFVWADSSANADFVSTAANQFLIRASGGVGIGTTSPAANLHVWTGGEGIRIQGPATGASNLAWESFVDGAGTRIGYVGDGSTGDHDVFLDADLGDVVLNTPAGRVLTATSTGNVGIGTSSPAERLTVGGSMEVGTGAGDYQHLRIGGGNSSGFLYGSYPHFGDGIHMGYNYYADAAGTNQIPHPDGGTSRISMSYGSVALATGPSFGGEPVDRLFVSSSGKVGIGTSAPVAALQVVIDGAATATGAAIWGQNTATSGAYFGVYGHSDSPSGYDFMAGGPGVNYGSPSSIRWKRNIRGIDDPLGKIERLRGIYFDWDEAHGGHHDLGMIAEEVGAVLPEIVNYEPDGKDATGMDYSRLTPLLVQAVNALRREKDAEIESIREENAQLRAQLAALLRRVQTLEQSASR